MTADPEDPHLGLVVEGPGDASSVPLILRKHLSEVGEYRDVLGKPIPCFGISNATRANGIEGRVAAAAARPGCGGVLVVLDGEYEPVCELGPQLGERAQTATGLPVELTLADPKFEGWLAASADTLALPNLEYPVAGDPERAIRNALKPAKYAKPTWQPRLAARVDLALVRSRSPSFDRMLTKAESLVQGL